MSTVIIHTVDDDGEVTVQHFGNVTVSMERAEMRAFGICEPVHDDIEYRITGNTIWRTVHGGASLNTAVTRLIGSLDRDRAESEQDTRVARAELTRLRGDLRRLIDPPEAA